MKFVYFFPAFGYFLLFIYGLYLFGVFPSMIDLPIYQGQIADCENYTKVICAHDIKLNGRAWYPTWGTLMILFALILLFWELNKSTMTVGSVTADHALSTIVFILYFGIWLSQPWAGNSFFLTITLMALLDVIAGFTISITAARRDFSVG